MCLLLTFQMHPSLRRRMLAPLTKRTKQSTLFECDEKRSATHQLAGKKLALEKFECDEKRSATERCGKVIPAFSCRLNAMKSGVQLEEIKQIYEERKDSLNAMKSGVQLSTAHRIHPSGDLFECDEKRSATQRACMLHRKHILFECDEKRSATLEFLCDAPCHRRRFECDEKRSATSTHFSQPPFNCLGFECDEKRSATSEVGE